MIVHYLKIKCSSLRPHLTQSYLIRHLML